MDEHEHDGGATARLEASGRETAAGAADPDRLLGPLPESGGPAETLLSERASATPLAPASGARAPERPAQGALPAMPRPAPKKPHRNERGEILPPIRGPLATLQQWFSTVITHPTSASDGLAQGQRTLDALGARDLEEIVTRGPKLSAAERLGLYQYAYHARLVECLIDDYPVLEQALGKSTFEVLARKYIEAHPSREPNLNCFGKHFASFCEAQAVWLEGHVFAADLARLEWAMVEVLHAQAAPTLSLAFLQELGPERWQGIKLPPSATLRLEEFSYPVNRYLQAVRTRAPEEALPVPVPRAEWSATAIYRQGFAIWRMDLTPPMARVLSALFGGATLGDALATLAGAATDGLETDVMAWFRAWVAGGFFARIEIEADSSHIRAS